MALRFEHEFMVPVPVERAWPVLLDVKRVAPCLPGATLESAEGDAFEGRIRVKVGPITVTYRGNATFVRVDPDARTLTLKAAGRETRGSGTANAEVTARLLEEGEHTRVRVETSFNVTGRPAQFGRGMLAEVGGKLIDRFAANLADLFAEGRPSADHSGPGQAEPESAGPPSDEPTLDRADTAVSEPERPPRAHRTVEEQELDLLEVVGAPLVRRLAVPVTALVALAALGYLVRRLRRRGKR